ncbi:hypothetical protein [Methylocella sp.]|uniref:hypothetical protein n=1 Tax=Methylocella sp. TaxID=1978226 RepID=UPI003C1EF894
MAQEASRRFSCRGEGLRQSCGRSFIASRALIGVVFLKTIESGGIKTEALNQRAGRHAFAP